MCKFDLSIVNIHANTLPLHATAMSPFRQETILEHPGSTQEGMFDMQCPFFHSDGVTGGNISEVTRMDSNSTALCAFKTCPGYIYTISFTNCENDGGIVALFSYTESSVLYELACGQTAVLDNAGYDSCRLVNTYQSCMASSNDSTPSCGGQVLIQGERLNVVNISFPSKSFEAGDVFSFNISQLTFNEGYLDQVSPVESSPRTSTSLTIGLYQSEVLAHQASCGHYSVAGMDLVDYLDKVEWNGREGFFTMSNYTISDFGATYRVVAWTHGLSKGVSKLGESMDVKVQGSMSVALEMDHFSRGSHVAGTFDFSPNAQSVSGDVIALYEVDGRGVCGYV